MTNTFSGDLLRSCLCLSTPSSPLSTRNAQRRGRSSRKVPTLTGILRAGMAVQVLAHALPLEQRTHAPQEQQHQHHHQQQPQKQRAQEPEQEQRESAESVVTQPQTCGRPQERRGGSTGACGVVPNAAWCCDAPTSSRNNRRQSNLSWQIARGGSSLVWIAATTKVEVDPLPFSAPTARERARLREETAFPPPPINDGRIRADAFHDNARPENTAITASFRVWR